MSDSDIRDTKKVMDFLQSNLDSLSRRVANLESTSPASQNLSRKVTPVVFNNTVAEETLFSGSLPGNSLRTTNFIELFALGLAANSTGGAVNFTWRLKYGTSSLVLGPFSLTASGTPTGRLFSLYGLLKARGGSETQQQFLGKLTVGPDYNVFTTNGLLRGFTISNIAEDSTIDQPVLFTIQHGTSDIYVKTTLILFKLGAPQVAA